MKKDIFPYGTHIYREPSRPLEELKKDMMTIKRLGFNMVKVQESWAIDEKRKGEIDLSKIEEIIKEAEALDLMVYFGVTMEQAPAWLWKEYPDCRLVYNDGTPHNDPTQYLLPADGKPGPCWDHPEVRREGERFICELVKRLGRYRNIVVWNVWQEVGFWPMYPGKLGFCYCPYTLAKFRNWLKARYDSIEKLNEVWRTGFGRWEEVEPPRLHPFVPSYIDWKYYMNNIYLREAIRWKAETFRKSDPYKRPVFCHMGSPSIGSGAEWRLAKEVDIFGSSCYPIWGDISDWDKDFKNPEGKIKGEMWNAISLKFDYIRSSCKGKKFWAAEFQGGPVSSFLYKGKTPAPGDIKRWVLTALSTGINGLCFWNHRAEIFFQEAYGFGLLDSKGDITERAKEAGALGVAINRYGELFQEGVIQKNEVAILVNEDLQNFLQSMPLHINNLTSEIHIMHTIRGLYRMLWEEGIFIDFLEVEEIERVRDYKVVILPLPLAISDGIMEKLEKFVYEGGLLISECCPGRYDRYGLARTGEISGIAEDVFGIEHKDVKLCGDEKTPWLPSARWLDVLPVKRFEGMGGFSSYSILPSLYIESFTVKYGTPILSMEKEITGVFNSYGKGKGYLIGTVMGHSFLSYGDEGTKKFLVKIIEDAGVKRSNLGKLLLRKKVLGEKEVLFLINPEGRAVSERLDTTGFSKAIDLLGGPVEGLITVEPFSVKVIILER